MISPSGREKILPPTRPNAGIETEYRRRLNCLIDEMHRSIMYWIGAAWKKRDPEIVRLAADDVLFHRWQSSGNEQQDLLRSGNEPQLLAADASPARSMLSVLGRLTTRWQAKFDDLAPDLVKWFATNSADRSDFALKSSLRRAGITVRFHTTRAVNDALQAAIGENVSLIKSIPSQYFTQIEGSVMRAIQRGSDLGSLAGDLEQHYGVTKRRAALIARDQNAKNTAVIARVRQQELGITEAIWMHSAGGKEPRPSHVKAGREREVFKIAQGWYDPYERKYVFPGELINCRCVSRPILPAAR